MSADKKTTKPTPKQEPKQKAASEVPNFKGAMAEMSWSVAIPFMFFILGGNWLDGRYETEPTFTIVGMFIGIAAIIVVVRRIVDKYYPDTYKSKDDK